MRDKLEYELRVYKLSEMRDLVAIGTVSSANFPKQNVETFMRQEAMMPGIALVDKNSFIKVYEDKSQEGGIFLQQYTEYLPPPYCQDYNLLMNEIQIESENRKVALVFNDIHNLKPCIVQILPFFSDNLICLANKGQQMCWIIKE